MINSNFINGLKIDEAKNKIIDKLEIISLEEEKLILS